jgi:transmembrane sensor
MWAVNAQRKDQMKAAEQAAQWLVRLEEDPGLQCHAEFVAWLKHSPRHLEELLLTAAAYGELDQLDPQRRLDVAKLLARSGAKVVPLQGVVDSMGAVSSRVPGRKAHWLQRKAFVAAAVTGLTLLICASVAIHFGASREGRYTTAIGEQRSIRLEDGSVVYLNTHSNVAVRFSEQARDIRLLEGEALFVVAHDSARPFRVRTGSALIQAVGTQFNVYERGNATTVSVVEGRVRVMPEERRGHLQHSTMQLVAAGEEARVSRNDVIKRKALDPSRAVAWRQRQFVFSGDSLAEVVEQVNRYNRTQFSIADPAVAQRHLSGVFNVDDIDSLLGFLNGDGDLAFERRGDELIIRKNTPSVLDD